MYSKAPINSITFCQSDQQTKAQLTPHFLFFGSVKTNERSVWKAFLYLGKWPGAAQTQVPSQLPRFLPFEAKKK